ncbi:uncharacterized protein Hap1MRO34_015904 [Clarias gariepinus]
MRASRDATIFIDLSFLSPEEEAIIQKVLVRDEDLKKHEIGRVRKLRERVPDQKELKVLSGEWFEDLKSKRYGRQPHVSAVVRSSMRWKKTAGHNTNPFLKAVPGDKGGEKNKTRPDVTTDPRSIHPALSVQVQQENKDEAIVLEESSGSELNKPVLKVIEAGHQSGPKPQEQTSFKMEPMQESKMKEVDTKMLDSGETDLGSYKEVKTIWDTPDPGRTELKKDRVVKTSWDTRDPGRTELKEDRVVKTSWDTRDPGRTELKEDRVVKTIWDTPDPGRTDLKEDRVVKTSWDTRDPGRTELKEDRVVKTSWDTRDPGRTELKEDRVVKTSWDTRDPGRTELKEDRVVKTSWDTRDPGRTELKEDRVVKTSWDTRDPGRTELKEDRVVKTSWDTRDPGRTELKEDRVVKTSWDTRDPGRTELKEDRVVKTSWDTRDPGRTDLKEDRVVKTSWDTRDPGRTELKEDRVVKTSWDTRDPGRTELKEDRVVKTNLQNRPKQTDEKTFRNFEIRSFSQAQESGNWGFGQLVAEEESIKPQSKVEVVKINSNNRTEIEVKNKQDSPRPRESSILINSGSGFEEKIQSPVPKKRSSDHIKVINVNSKQTTPTRKEELSVDLDMKKDPGVLEDLKPSPVNNVNTEVYFNVDHKSLDPVQKRKGSAVQEFMVDEQRSSRRTEELSVDLDQRRSPDVSIGPVSNVNPEIKYISLDKSLDPVQKGKERAVEEILVADFKQRSSTRTEELSVDLDVKNNSDISEAPGYNLNTEKSVNWKQKTFDPPRKGKEEVVEEIVVQEIKQRSPKRLEERIIDINVEENPDVVEDLKTRQVQKDVRKYERVLADTKSDELPDSVMKNRKNEAAGGKNGFDVKLRESESTNQKVSKEIEAMEKGGRGDENGISESDILASVYARATRPKPEVNSLFSLSRTFPSLSPYKSMRFLFIPCISNFSHKFFGIKLHFLTSSKSLSPPGTDTPCITSLNEGHRDNEIICFTFTVVKNETPTPEAVVDVEKAGADIWEDVAVDSDEDSSSASSHDSDLSGKRSQVSATTLSVKERTASLLSVYSDAGDFGNVAVQGSVEFAIMYSPLGELVIMVEQCQDLAIANTRKQRTDPYVKTYLYPDKRSKRKTSIKKHTVNPVFVESLRYKVKREELHGKTLNLSVWHNDSRGRNAFLGQVEINLKDWNWKHEAVTWYNLQPKTADILESQEYRGVLFVSLKYVPAEATGGSRISQPTGEIHIWLREAKHLRRLKAQGVDSFVKCYMLPDTSKKSRQKTRVVKKTQDPVYNHTMVYDGFRVGELCEACCELTVWDNHKLSNQFLGGVRLSLGTGQSYGKKVDWMDSENEEVEIWKKMMANPNSWVEGELSLRASMTPRK